VVVKAFVTELLLDVTGSMMFDAATEVFREVITEREGNKISIGNFFSCLVMVWAAETYLRRHLRLIHRVCNSVLMILWRLP
jgi:hypothetical protein